jgi:hypothetical protein
VPGEIEGGVRREAGDQNGQNDEIGIMCSGNDHQNRRNFGQRPAGDASAFQSPKHYRMLLWRFAGKIPSRAVDLGCYESGHGTELPILNVRSSVTIRAEADIRQMG